MYYGWYFDPTMLLILPALLLAMWAQFRVQSTFRKYSDVPSAQGWTAAEMAADLLARNGLGDVRVERVRGSLTDHYDPRTNTLRLSDTVYGSTSLAALGVAAHECGHAMQEAEGYKPLRIREKIVPVAQIGSWAAMPLFVLGLVMSWEPLLTAGIIVFSLVVAFYLVTLPVEFDASGRALEQLEGGGYLSSAETDDAGRVLRAAALTYVAAALQAVLQLLRLLVLAGGNRRNRDEF